MTQTIGGLTDSHNHSNITPQQQPSSNIASLLQRYEKTQITVREYCEISKLALRVSPQIIMNSYEQFENTPQRSQKTNYVNLVGFLCHPNISYSLSQRTADLKKAETMIEAGKKVVAMIAYAWDYYINVLRERKKEQGVAGEHKQGGVSADDRVRLSLRRIEEMLDELQAHKYNWENYTKEGLISQRQNAQELQQELSFIHILNNFILTEIDRVAPTTQQPQQPNQSKIVPALKQDHQPQKQHSEKNYSICMDVEGYYRRKLESRTTKKPQKDPIDQLQQQRKFNAAAIRYYMEKAK